MGCCGDSDGEKRREEEDDGSDYEPKEGGQPMQFDPNFKGPIDKRSCTDILCCLLFIIGVSAFIGVGIFAYSNGDPKLLLYPTDSNGNLCGYGEFKERPYLFFFDLLECARVGIAVTVTGCPTPQVCVERCPSDSWEWVSLHAEERLNSLEGTNYNKRERLMICKDKITRARHEDKTVKELVQDEDCAAYYLNSTSLAGRCIPSFIHDTFTEVQHHGMTLVDKLNNTIAEENIQEGTKYLAYLLNAKEVGVKVYQDVRASWWMITIGLVFAMVWCFVWIILMRCIAGFMVWLTIFLFVTVFAACTAYCVYKYMELRGVPEDTGTVEFTTNLDYYLNLTYTWLALGTISGLILLIVVIIMLFLRSRIRIAIALIKEASRALGFMILALFWPLLPWVLEICVFGYWGASVIYLASMGNIEGALVHRNETFINGTLVSSVLVDDQMGGMSKTIPCDPRVPTSEGEVCNFLKYGGTDYTGYLQLFQLFMLFWIANFIVALGQMTLAGAFASYYWAFQKPKDIPATPVASALYRTVRFHMGTLAFGSLIIAIVQLIRVILEYLDHKLKGATSKPAKFVLKCLKCCFWCLEKFLKFLNKNAYIMTAVYGYNFCKSAAVAFNLILRNIIRVAVVDKVTDFLIFIGKLVVVGVVSLVAFVYFSGELAEQIPTETLSDYIKDYTPELNFYLIPVIIIGLGSYIIASGFFAVYSMGVDTLFLCFLQDLEVNNGSAEKPYYMNRDLMQILGKKNVPEVERAKRNK